MRQAMLLLAIAAIASPALATSPDDGATPAATPQHASPANAGAAPKPLSPIGRALAGLMDAANARRPQARGVADPATAMPADAAGVRLAAESPRDSTPR